MDLNDVLELVGEDLLLINEKLIEKTDSNISLIKEISTYIINSGGKRIRPMLSILFGKLLEVEKEDAINIGVITELIHTATILHDDVVDDSSMRRGMPTVNKKYNNPAAVLVGDFVYTRAFQLIAQYNNPALMKLYTDAVNVISEGEVRQLVNLGDLTITEEKYMDVIHKKTAKLFEVCCHALAMLKYPNQPEIQNKLAKYGTYLGTGFQIIDDIIDYESSEEVSGKNPGDDLAEGKPTLPIIRLREIGTESDKKLVEEIILQKRSIESLEYVTARLNANDCFNYCRQIAYKNADLAKETIADFPDSKVKEVLLFLADLSVKRDN